MTRRRVELDAPPSGAHLPPPAADERPSDVERFRTLVGSVQANAESGSRRTDDAPLPSLPQQRAPQAADLELAHVSDFDPTRVHRSLPGERREDQVPAPVPGMRRAGASTAAADAARAPAGGDPGHGSPREDSVARAPRRPGRLRTHGEREQAMKPIVALLEAAQRRAPPRDAAELTIVPPAPNPLRLSLSLAMHGDDFVVKATTALGAEHREHVLQSLNALEQALSRRLREPVRARVILLA